jgi:hypothetical protein
MKTWDNTCSGKAEYEYVTMHSSSLISYDNTQSELKVLIVGEIMYY